MPPDFRVGRRHEDAARLSGCWRGCPGSGVGVLLHGEGSRCWAALRRAVGRGLDTRIGLEDVLVLPDGTPAPDDVSLIRAARALVDAAPEGDRNRRVLRTVRGAG